jgi:23S rRNA-/tRNA-specific pseudouridylate synthase
VSESCELAVLFADEQLIAVDKPAGLHTAPQGREGEVTLLSRLLEQFPEIAAVPGIKPAEPGLLHRLDHGTSGIVLAARTPEAFRRLAAEFAAGRVRKEYLALCVPGSAVLAGQRFAMESRFAPCGPGRKKVRVVSAGALGGAGADSVGHRADSVGFHPAGLHRVGRSATSGTYRTEAEVLEVQGPRVLVRAAIVRGFRHQVRAHLAFLGLPIVGDPLYGVPVPPGAADRLYLHASAVELQHPASGQPLRIRSPLPLDFELRRK